jgi:hypothetical protein
METPTGQQNQGDQMDLPTNKAINAIFDLPSAPQTFLWYHASAGFPVKESFIKAVRNGNYATWPKLAVTLINKYMPDSDETAKGHLKGQRQGIRSPVATEKFAVRTMELMVPALSKY